LQQFEDAAMTSKWSVETPRYAPETAPVVNFAEAWTFATTRR